MSTYKQTPNNLKEVRRSKVESRRERGSECYGGGVRVCVCACVCVCVCECVCVSACVCECEWCAWRCARGNNKQQRTKQIEDHIQAFIAISENVKDTVDPRTNASRVQDAQIARCVLCVSVRWYKCTQQVRGGDRGTAGK